MSHILASLSEVSKIIEGHYTIPAYGMLVGLPGRHGAGQIEALFMKSGLFGDPTHIMERGAPDLKHAPFLVVSVSPEATVIRIEIIRNARALLDLSDDVGVLAQWPGEHRSDWFHFSVGDFRSYVARAQEKGKA